MLVFFEMDLETLNSTVQKNFDVVAGRCVSWAIRFFTTTEKISSLVVASISFPAWQLFCQPVCQPASLPASLLHPAGILQTSSPCRPPSRHARLPFSLEVCLPASLRASLCPQPAMSGMSSDVVAGCYVFVPDEARIFQNSDVT